LNLEKEELSCLQKQKDELFEKEMIEASDIPYSYKSTQYQALGPSSFNQINGFEDRLVITVEIKVSGYQSYSLDA
jgi:hypothetical protein